MVRESVISALAPGLSEMARKLWPVGPPGKLFQIVKNEALGKCVSSALR